MDDAYGLSTPEQVELQYDLAGLGSRFLAALVDVAIQLAVMLGLMFATGVAAGILGRVASGWLDAEGVVVIMVALLILVVFLIIWGYYIFFELIWNGQTPGKRLLGIRVLTTAGQPITLAHSLIRNLVRLVDFLPSSYMIGTVAILASPRSQRLGDLAAGTLVIKEHREPAPTVLPAPPAAEALPPQVAAAITAEDVALAREFLLRRDTLPLDRRRALADRIANRLRARLDPATAAEPAETVLARVAAIRR